MVPVVGWWRQLCCPEQHMQMNSFAAPTKITEANCKMKVSCVHRMTLTKDAKSACQNSLSRAKTWLVLDDQAPPTWVWSGTDKEHVWEAD